MKMNIKLPFILIGIVYSLSQTGSQYVSGYLTGESEGRHPPQEFECESDQIHSHANPFEIKQKFSTARMQHHQMNLQQVFLIYCQPNK
jgi:hypothetical protein